MSKSRDLVRTESFGGEEEVSRTDRILPAFNAVVPDLKRVNFRGVVGGNLQMDRRLGSVALRHANRDRRIGGSRIARLPGQFLV